jgi:hypothetical protein
VLTTTITLTVTAPTNALGGVEINTTVTATSIADPNISEAFDFSSWVYYQKLLPLIFGGN